MTAAGFKDQVAVNFVGTDQQIMALAELGNGCELGFFPRSPHGVVGVAKQEKPGCGGDRRLRRQPIPAPAAGYLLQRGGTQAATGKPGSGHEWRVDRRSREHIAIARPASHVQPGHQPRQPDQRLSLYAPAVLLFEMADRRLDQ